MHNFTVYCAHRSGSNYYENLLKKNFKDLRSLHHDRQHHTWKHAGYTPGYKNGRKFTCIIARHPIKWVNGCVQFNADMWKWWGVDTSQSSELTFYYNKKHISIPKMVAKWNKFYNSWLDNTDSFFVWYPDLLDEDTKKEIVRSTGSRYDLEWKTDTIADQTYVVGPHEVTNTKYNKKDKELDIENNPNLTEQQVNYIIEHIDYKLIEKMSERREYENSGSIQWPA